MTKEVFWTSFQLNKFKNLYSSATFEEIKKEYPRFENDISIYNTASKYKLKRNDSHKKLRNGDISVLLNESLETYYWIGFIAADGCINSKNSLIVALAYQDKQHLEKLSKYLNTNLNEYIQSESGNFSNPNTKSVRISINHAKYIKELKNKFDFKLKKTYNPPDVEKLKNVLIDDKLFAFIVGFLDGDGSIYSSYSKNSVGKIHYKMNLKLTNHHTWNKIHNFFIEYLLKEFPSLGYMKSLIFDRTFKDGRKGRYVTFSTTKKLFLKELYEKILLLKLPYLERKWDQLKGNQNEKKNTFPN